MPSATRLARAVSPVLALATIAAFALPGAAHAQTLLSDNFDTENGGVPQSALNYNSFVNWDVTGGTVDLYSPYNSLTPSFGNSVDLDGSTGNAGILTTKTVFVLTPGDYILRFDLGKNGGASESVAVSLGSAFAETFSSATNAALAGAIGTPVTLQRAFTVSGATVNAPLVFDHAGGDNSGFVLDNVSLVRVQATAVPEPGALALLALPALVGAVAVRRRRGAA